MRKPQGLSSSQQFHLPVVFLCSLKRLIYKALAYGELKGKGLGAACRICRIEIFPDISALDVEVIFLAGIEICLGSFAKEAI